MRERGERQGKGGEGGRDKGHTRTHSSTKLYTVLYTVFQPESYSKKRHFVVIVYILYIFNTTVLFKEELRLRGTVNSICLKAK